jgi:N-acetylmuramoyl-L-alanine amidase
MNDDHPISYRRRTVPAEIDVMCRTVWGEARGERIEGQIEVAHVIRNRVEKQSWWGRTFTGVCTYPGMGVDKPHQFSCWNVNDPNYGQMMLVDLEDASFRKALYVTLGVLEGELPSRLEGKPCHYHTSAVSPSWADDGKFVGAVGNHRFYAGIK